MKHEIVIVGGGSAGMTAALYALQSGHTVQVVEKNMFSGQAVQVTDSAGRNHSNLSSIFDEAVALAHDDQGRYVLTGSGRKLYADAVILALGVSRRTLGLCGEKAYIGKGIYFCDMGAYSFCKGKTVCVAGHDAAAVKQALVLAEICEKVYLLHITAELDADPELLTAVYESERIKVIPEASITRLLERGRSISGIEYQETRSGFFHILACDALFESVGIDPLNQSFADSVDLDDSGYILTDEDCRTSAEGVFAAGRCRGGTQSCSAVCDGISAAHAVCRYLAEAN